jgi:sortase (surface protein transpeptidase)
MNNDNGQKQEADGTASPPTLAFQQLPAAITPATVWENDAVVTYNAFTLPEKAAFDNGSIGVLSIEKIGLAVNVYESSNQMEDMEKGVAHGRP